MKTFIIVLCLFTVCSCAHQPWNKRDIALGVAAVGITAMDWSQTLQIADNPDFRKELNPILGPHPSRGDVNLYFASTLAIGWAVCQIFPELRPYVIGGWIGVEGVAVSSNLRQGLRPWK